MASPSAASAAQDRSSDLCDRCRELRIIDLLLDGDVRDELPPERGREMDITGAPNLEQFRNLGPFGSITFDDSCALCRLIKAIFPPKDEVESPDTEYYLRPMRMYNRLGFGLALGDVEEDVKKQYAICISIATRDQLARGVCRHLGEPQDTALVETGYSFALTGNSKTAAQPGLPARVRGVTIDPDVVTTWLRRCELEHHDCQAAWSDELLTTRMIDVESCTVVDTPPHCRYIALSYVWGNVVPEERALEKGTLPPTIQDAILATKSLGIRYLWVDAVCIDQRPSPQKLQQLRIMDLIYNGAYATIIALDGDSSNAGLRGVSQRSPRQLLCCEWIDGHELAVVYPPVAKEIQEATCKHSTRAWTLQELVLSRRRIFFGKNQVHYICGTMGCEESINDTVDPARVLDREMKSNSIAEFEDVLKLQKLSSLQPPSDDLRRKATDDYYTQLLSLYTTRFMTNDSDSLNACLGLLNFLQRSLVPGGFVWGLPLREFPQSLRWYHMRWVKPRRRIDFPSWSFVGWEGEVGYSDALILKGSTGHRCDEEVDMGVEFAGISGMVLTLKGFGVKIEIRNEPFNTAYIPGTDLLMGTLQEGNVLHKFTLPEGIFEFVVIERLKYKKTGGEKERHMLFLIMLEELSDGSRARRSMVRLYVDLDFMGSDAYTEVIQGRENIEIR